MFPEHPPPEGGVLSFHGVYVLPSPRGTSCARKTCSGWAIFRAKRSLQEQQERTESKGELGYEMMYYFLQYTKAKQVQLLREVKSRVLSLDQDLVTVRNRLEASTGIGLVDPTTGQADPRQLEIIQQKVREDLRHYPHMVNLLPNLENFYVYNKDAVPASALTGSKRKAGGCPFGGGMPSVARGPTVGSSRSAQRR